MKVYWIVSNYPSSDNPQAGVFYRILAEELARKGISITIIAPVPYAPFPLYLFSDRWKAYHNSLKREEGNGVSVYRPRYVTHPGESRVAVSHLSMALAIRSIRLTPPDLVHGFGAYPASRTAVDCARHWKVPLITTFIGSDVNRDLSFGRRNARRFYETVEASSLLFAVSEALAAKIRTYTNRDVKVMPMPVKWMDQPHLSRKELRQKWAIPEDRFVVLFVGYLHAEKGVNELCEALSAIGHEKVFGVFIGGKTPLVSRVNKLTNAVWLGQLKQEDVFAVMCAADVLVLPSYHEGTPGVIKEAGMAQLPVIASRVGGIPEMLGEERGYLINSHSSAAILTAIHEIMDNPERAKVAAKQLSTYTKDHYTDERIAGELLQYYYDAGNDDVH